MSSENPACRGPIISSPCPSEWEISEYSVLGKKVVFGRYMGDPRLTKCQIKSSMQACLVDHEASDPIYVDLLCQSKWQGNNNKEKYL